MTARRTARPLILTVAALGIGVPAVALAQEVGPYEPLGIRAGSFLIFPSLNVSEIYDDNVFASDNNTDDDLITVISPQVRVEFQLQPTPSGSHRGQRGRLPRQ